MTDTPGEHLDEEPQDERGTSGSRDAGSEGASGGPADRPSGTSDEESDTSVHPQGSDDDAPDLPTP